MEVTVDWEQKNLMNELTQGKELAKQLRNHLNPSSTPETRLFLVEKILRSYEKALSMLDLVAPTEAKPAISFLDQSQSPAPFADDSPKSEGSHKKDVFKKRKTMSRWTEQVKLCSGSSLEGPPDDGYYWRKYGQKDILGSKFPRGYYRCTHRPSQGCLATKQVQRSDEDPTILEVTYRGRHTCKQASNLSAAVVKLVPKENNSNHCQQQQGKPKQTQDVLLSFGAAAGLRVKNENLDGMEEIFHAFSFPPVESEEEGNSIFKQSMVGNDIMGSLSPAFISPATSESNYFSPCHMGSFGLGQNGQTSESDLTEIVSAPTSVANSPIGDLGFSIDNVEIDSNFSFDYFEYFS